MLINDSLESNIKIRVQCVITFAIIVQISIILFFLFKGNVPEANKEIIFTLIGSLTAMLLQSFNYFFGSNSSSQEKDKMIYNSKPLEIKNKEDKL